MSGDCVSTMICIRDTVDAGGTYGNRKPRAEVCWDGILEGTLPSVGDCVILQTQGESSVLAVEKATGCP